MSVELTISVDDDTFRALERLSSRTQTPLDRLLLAAVRDYVDLTTRQLARIEEGIAAAENGDFASEADVERVRRRFVRFA